MNENGFMQAYGSLALTIHITFIIITLNKNMQRLALKLPEMRRWAKIILYSGCKSLGTGIVERENA